MEYSYCHTIPIKCAITHWHPQYPPFSKWLIRATPRMLLGLGLARPSPLPQRCNFLKINIITNCYILNWNLYLSIENQWIRWILFLLLGCRKFGAPLWRSSCKISHGGIFSKSVCQYRRAINTKYDEFVTSCLVYRSNYDLFNVSRMRPDLSKGNKEPV